MQNDPGAEWIRLTRLYQEKSDEELLALAEDFGNLTETAQGVLRDEIRKRKLDLTKSSEKASEVANERRVNDEPEKRARFGGWNQASAVPGAEEDRSTETVEFTWKTLLCECNDSDEAWQVREVLRRAGIESWIEGLQSPSQFDLGSPRITVAADQLEEAKMVIAKPIPQDLIDQSKDKPEDFIAPTCPKCGADDPLLESVEPSNTWICENCGAQWSDGTTVENKG
jgi:hypothetical protein